MNIVYKKMWNKEYHIKVFSKRINDEQYHLADVKILFHEEDKLQFYIEQMYDRTMFENEEMMKW